MRSLRRRSVEAIVFDLDGLWLACRRMGTDPTRVAYVGDSLLDIEAALRGGALAVAAAWGHQYDPVAPAQLTAHHPHDIMALLTRTAR